ncbi:MAG: GNAT family N-acetyltransferase, partial [Flavobacteriales bacterium]
LRAIETSDVDLLYKWENNPEIWPESETFSPYSKETLKAFAQSVQDIYTQKQLRLIICKKEDHKAIGTVELYEFSPKDRRAGVGILIADKENRKKGFASDALDILIDHCFKILDLHQLYCHINTDNEESLNLFKKKGFKTTGTLEEWRNVNGVWKDEYFLQLIKK